MSVTKFSVVVHSDPQLSLECLSCETEKETSAEAVPVFAPVTAERDCGTPNFILLMSLYLADSL